MIWYGRKRIQCGNLRKYISHHYYNHGIEKWIFFHSEEKLKKMKKNVQNFTMFIIIYYLYFYVFIHIKYMFYWKIVWHFLLYTICHMMATEKKEKKAVGKWRERVARDIKKILANVWIFRKLRLNWILIFCVSAIYSLCSDKQFND